MTRKRRFAYHSTYNKNKQESRQKTGHDLSLKLREKILLSWCREQCKTRKGRSINDNTVNNKIGLKDDPRHKKKSDERNETIIVCENKPNQQMISEMAPCLLCPIWRPPWTNLWRTHHPPVNRSTNDYIDKREREIYGTIWRRLAYNRVEMEFIPD